MPDAPLPFIPVNDSELEGNALAYLSECVGSGWISAEGPMVARFEEAFARRVGRRFGIAMCNGSAALDAAVAAIELGPGDEVIMPSFTIISCAAAVARAGALPVLVDCDELTWNMDVAQVAASIGARTKAIMAVHIYGLPVDMDPLAELARKHNLVLIEDAAEAHGLSYRGRPSGSFGALSTFSFYPNKLVTTGEGGMIVTDDERLAERCRSLRNLCFRPGRRFVHDELGWNFRMTSLQAALGLAQLERLDEFAVRKRAIGARYRSRLEAIDWLQLPLPATAYAENIYWVFGVVSRDQRMDAELCMRRLHELGVGTRPFFWPMHEQPVFQARGWF